jgi:hypothetical protein
MPKQVVANPQQAHKASVQRMIVIRRPLPIHNPFKYDSDTFPTGMPRMFFDGLDMLRST